MIGWVIVLTCFAVALGGALWDRVVRRRPPSRVPRRMVADERWQQWLDEHEVR